MTSKALSKLDKAYDIYITEVKAVTARRKPNPEIAHRILVQVAIRVIEKQRKAEREGKAKSSEPEEPGSITLGQAAHNLVAAVMEMQGPKLIESATMSVISGLSGIRQIGSQLA